MICVCHIALYVCFVCVRLRLLLPRPVTFGGLSGSKLNVKVEATFSRNGQRIGVKEVTGQKYAPRPAILRKKMWLHYRQSVLNLPP